ncbi:MAG: GSCFA domain-containing protein, partial [Candidatus Cryptobacteroides sp.]
MKLNTPVIFPPSRIGFGYEDHILVLGSCFAASTGQKLIEHGFDALVNPFGTLYNPASVVQCIERLESGKSFVPEDCVEVGAGSGRICSFHHHTLAAKESAVEFLQSANETLERACGFWKDCGKIIITLGTSWCYRHRERDMVVANCLKRNASEFERFFL